MDGILEAVLELIWALGEAVCSLVGEVMPAMVDLFGGLIELLWDGSQSESTPIAMTFGVLLAVMVIVPVVIGLLWWFY